MSQIKLFIELTRLNKPIGYMLLFWPCAWGLTLAYDFNGEKITYLFYISLFFIGAILMRSAGCIVNDIADRKFDKKISRTKKRPIASGQISILKGIIYSLVLCSFAFLILIQFNYFTIILALGSMPLAFTYPYMKRYTYWPQLFLGVTFNYGLLLGWSSIYNEINLITIIFYLSSIFWTLGYDTIYGFQDIKDDEIIGLKSTSIKFKSNPYFFLKICYLIFLLGLIMVGYYSDYNFYYFIMIAIISIQLFYTQIFNLNTNIQTNCLKTFKSNNILGLFVFLAIVVGKI
jgi:4-hydroxybenzoate polyprenyltransferase